MVDLLCAARVENSTESASCTCKPVYAAIIPNIAISSFLCYTTAMMNIVTIYALGKTSSILKPLKILLLSLAVSDLCTGLLSLPLNIAWQIQMLRCNLDKIPAVLNVFCSNFLYLSSLLGLTVLSADRFVAIQMPLRYKELVTHKRVRSSTGTDSSPDHNRLLKAMNELSRDSGNLHLGETGAGKQQSPK
ncbi:hypothetical protein pdam_00020726 [Pocillopora damicornis]|uniref:G-protein coupled receptors family 1 profile domain-containing protein n=1 Tax=Pocillopora damicornis TaxID=46731 RepID=A0A3M6TWB0_POCDA|nr:hypothetical protein pdam_00020726 [Pocillopora damicornis]